MKKLNPNLIIIVVATLIAILCIYGTPVPAATVPGTTTSQATGTIETASQATVPTSQSNTTADILALNGINDSAEPTVPTDIWVHTAYPARETFSIEVRMQLRNDDGTIDYIDMEGLAVGYSTDCPKPFLNLIRNINYTKVEEVWIRSSEFHISKVNCCTSYTPDENDGWTKISCCQEHLGDETPYQLYQLINTDKDGYQFDTAYLTLFFFD